MADNVSYHPGVLRKTKGYRFKTSKGYWVAKAPGHPHCNAKGYVGESRLVAEAALGRVLPRKAVVHHVDGDTGNNATHNLVICENQSYHNLLHRRARIIRRGGSPARHRTCGRCDVLHEKTMFHADRAAYDGRSGTCKPCRKVLNQQQKQRISQ